ncbi:MAG: hypothetical protein OXC09_10845 [Truepera sp.]|nr:hypothetical protein [Truepera sp.]
MECSGVARTDSLDPLTHLSRWGAEIISRYDQKLKELEKENARLKKLLADPKSPSLKDLDIDMLKEVIEGKY